MYGKVRLEKPSPSSEPSALDKGKESAMASFAQQEGPQGEEVGSLYDQVHELQKRIRFRQMHRKKVSEEIVSLTKEKHLLDGKISGIQSNFNRLHKLTQAAIQTTKRHRKERIAGEREIENLKQHIQQHKQEISKYDQQTAGLTEETDQLKLSLEKLGAIGRELRRRIQQNKIELNKHVAERNFLYTRERTVKGRVDQSVSQNAKSIMQIEQLLMDVKKLHDEPF